MFDITFSIFLVLILNNNFSEKELNLLQNESNNYNEIICTFYKIIITFCILKFLHLLCFIKKIIDNMVYYIIPYVIITVFLMWGIVF